VTARAYTRGGRGDAKDAGVHDEQLHALIGATRADGAVDARRRGRWLRRQLQEAHGFGDALRGVPVGAVIEAWTTTGRHHRGTLRAVAPLVVVDTDAGVAHVVGRAIVGLQPLADASTPAGRDTPSGPSRDLGDLLIDLAADRTPVAVCTRDGWVHRGIVDVVGSDHVRLAGGMTLLRLDRVTEVVEPLWG
jgi:hypothetical protein